LNKLPKSQQSKLKRALQEVWMAETKIDALVAVRCLRQILSVKYDKAMEPDQGSQRGACRQRLPAEHWKHLSTTDVVESAFGRSPPHGALQGMSFEQDRNARHDLQTR
jgi:hypothetical protein